MKQQYVMVLTQHKLSFKDIVRVIATHTLGEATDDPMPKITDKYLKPFKELWHEGTTRIAKLGTTIVPVERAGYMALMQGRPSTVQIDGGDIGFSYIETDEGKWIIECVPTPEFEPAFGKWFAKMYYSNAYTKEEWDQLIVTPTTGVICSDNTYSKIIDIKGNFNPYAFMSEPSVLEMTKRMARLTRSHECSPEDLEKDLREAGSIADDVEIEITHLIGVEYRSGTYKGEAVVNIDNFAGLMSLIDYKLNTHTELYLTPVKYNLAKRV